MKPEVIYLTPPEVKKEPRHYWFVGFFKLAGCRGGLVRRNILHEGPELSCSLIHRDWPQLFEAGREGVFQTPKSLRFEFLVIRIEVFLVNGLHSKPDRGQACDLRLGLTKRSRKCIRAVSS